MTDFYRACLIPLVVLTAVLVFGAAPVLALDCSTADTLACGGTTLSYKLKDGVATSGTFCGAFSGYDSAFVFVVVADSMTRLTFTPTSTPGGAMDLFLLNSCNEWDCVSGTAGGMSGAPLSICVDAGTYFLAASSATAANATFTIQRACASCIVTPIESTSWGTIKAQYQ